MSDLAILWARRCRVGSSTARLVLLELAHRADPFDATVGISAGSLAEQCEIHPDTARTALRRLEQLGALSGEGASGKFRLNVDVSIDWRRDACARSSSVGVLR